MRYMSWLFRWHPYILGLLLSTVAWGWDSAGHRTVGAIADALIAGSAAQKQVAQILGPTETLRQAAIWPDCVKSIDPTRNFAYIKNRYYDVHCQFFDQTEAGIQAMQDYVKRNNSNCQYNGLNQNCHKTYHFVDIPIQQGRYEDSFVSAIEHDIVHAMKAALQVLQDQAPPSGFAFAPGNAGKAEALRLLTHLVGDEHQPLHVGAIYLDDRGAAFNPQTEEDSIHASTQGGNLLTIGQENLHYQWDTLSNPLSLASVATQSRALPMPPGDVGSWPAAWASESVRLAAWAHRGIQFGIRHGKTWPIQFTHPQTYHSARERLQTKQIIKAGTRLAQLLHTIWPE